MSDMVLTHKPARTKSTVRTGLGLPIRGVIALGYLGLLALGAVFADFIGVGDPLRQNLLGAKMPPGEHFWLGSDQLGRDIFARLIYGAREVMLGASEALLIAFGLGVTAGLAAGYVRGRLDSILSAIADMLQSVPAIAVLLAVLAVFEGNIHAAMILFGVLASAAMFRVVRAATMSISEERYVLAARLAGVGTWTILWRHLARRLRSVLMVQSAIVVALAIVNQVGLSFLGLGSKPPAPTWGSVLMDGAAVLFTDTWMIIPPVVMISITILAVMVVGDAFQDAATTRIGRGSPIRPSVRYMPGAGARFGTVAISNQQPLVEVSGLSIGIGGRGTPLWLIQDVSFSVRHGEIVGLVGESGAGKSVAARAILNMFPNGSVVEGTIRYAGREVVPPARGVPSPRIGYISQQPMAALDPAFTIGNQLCEAIALHDGARRGKEREKAMELLDLVQIREPSKVLELYPHQISGGMAQRVAIAIALSGNPQLLVADEPTTALDVTVQLEILNLLKALQQQKGLAILLVTHDWGVVARMCERVITFYAGEIVESAGVSDIFFDPRHPYTRALRAADPHGQRGVERLPVIAGQVPPPGKRPSGCNFQARCQFGIARCALKPIELETYGDDRHVRCIRLNELKVPR
ncbi:dipeptide/oligopeptide/nickel ABC transporter permease/ATP-binding protein [Pelagibacterium lentulum]|uniref:Dipeptide/oligopeptide/nickel ABC transporter ATP-binding protein n=1 Tax=Pelagibacterium lentulum TaxID=2029865 RepID=A0A916VXD2_9HYPH|nr:dipeptide/oligopeptide/nickel ABC transporter permease/ATP-binding protein [Pelagibacterium lentulum]GGA48563.1 dipeptide/oligopeptide/nickel ABC transporter ATP-binding protein [Pelagibacterium lentulum]